MPLRQTTGFVESLLRLAGLNKRVPNGAIPYRGGTGPLHLLIDMTGMKAEGEGEWSARTHPPHTCKHVLPGHGCPYVA